MKAQDFMNALGGISQEKLDALAEWQDAKTPVSGEETVPEKRITQTAAVSVPNKRSRGTMKQKTKQKTAVTRLFPWNIGIGAAVAACALIAVSIGKEVITQEKQMQTGMSETSIAEQISEDTANEPQIIEVSHEPIELIDMLAVCGGSDYVMMKVPQEGAVQVLRSVADAEVCCQYTDDKNVAGENFDFRKKLTEEVFAEYDVLYFAFKDNQLPLYLYTYDLAGGSIAADGTTLHLSFHALMHDPEHLPSNVLYSYDDYEPDWNTYYFYTVPKGSLPDLSAITVSFEEYPIGAIPDELLTSTGETVEISDNGYITKHTKLQEYLETTQEYLDYVTSMPKPKFITWENSTEMLTDDCTEDNRGQLMPD